MTAAGHPGRGWRAAYRLLMPLAVPVAFAYLLWRSRREPAYRRDWAQRLGHLPRDLPTDAVWIHAASVGEVQAIAPLVDDLLGRSGAPPVIVTTATPTGRARLRERFGDAVHHAYLPFDLPAVATRFLARLKPAVGVIVEMELWPEILGAAHARGLPLLLVNARLSERSLQRYRRFAGLLAPALATFHWIGAQTEADARRLRALGAPPERVSVAGNIKFDQEIPRTLITAGAELRRALGDDRPIWVAASTHDGEETIALDAHRRIRERHPDAVLVLVPRHPQRFAAVAELLRGAGEPFVRRSDIDRPPDRRIGVYLGDSMGELPAYLAAADVVFVGGSLVPVGGHNLLEPAALGRPVVSGPHRFNFSEVSRLLTDAGALSEVTDADSLGATIADLLGDAARRRALGEAALGVVAANRGARAALLTRVLAALEEADKR